MPGFIITVGSNNRVWYLIGTIVFLLLGIGMTIAGFAGDTVGLGVVGIAFVVVSIVLLIDAIMNLSD